jgi:hypothetical protein
MPATMLCEHKPICCRPRLPWLFRNCPGSADCSELGQSRVKMSLRIDNAAFGRRTASAKLTQARRRRVFSESERDLDDQVRSNNFFAAMCSVSFPKLVILRRGLFMTDDRQKPGTLSKNRTRSESSATTALNSRFKMRSSIPSDDLDLSGTYM